jgi:hypothetical protein
VIGKRESIERLKLAVERLHNCSARHVTTTPVREVLRGSTAWQGDVEVFALTKHPKARRCFAWLCEKPKPCFVIVLEDSVIVSPEIAVREKLQP